MRKLLLFAILGIVISSISITSISAQSQSEIPAWVKGVADYWVKGNISDSDFGESISFLIEQNIIKVDMPNQDNSILQKKVNNLETRILDLESENKNLKTENAKLNDLLDDLLGTSSSDSYSDYLENGCHKNNPYLWSDGYCHSTVEPDCPVNKPYYWSNGFCYNSPEYLSNGCHNDYPYLWSDGLCYTIKESNYNPPTDDAPKCDPSYPDVCIPPYPPDLNCGDIGYSNFRVIGSDPHGFDRDNDGIGCES
ncbi:hypothetical protein [Nitrosopumilus cobalaminigenes]|uniref:hypothetical protein n=1 Tax=Nitrosopumilus cobalaminigenes TaxID=1470066 RepID=UPI001C53B1EB|nr:hypothetical protein [Nitrosopumilus cobalaminigenes]